MTAHDALLHHLRESVRERATPDPAPGPGRRARRRLGRRRGVVVALAALVVGGGVAGAAQVGVLPGIRLAGDHPPSAREVAYAAMLEANRTRACRRMPSDAGATTTTAKIAAVAVPLLAGPPSARAEASALKVNHGGPVVAGSARSVVFSDGSRLLLWLAVGNGPGSYVDPVACGMERIARLHADKPDPSSRLRQKAETVLRGYRDTLPGLQMLSIMFHDVGGRSSGGVGIPLDGRRLNPGIVLSAGDGDYLGYAAAGATRVTVDWRGGRRWARVVRRLFLVRLPRGTGPVVLRQRAADGRVLSRQTIRE